MCDVIRNYFFGAAYLDKVSDQIQIANDLVFSNLGSRQTSMGKLNEGSCGYSGEALVIKHICCNLANNRFSGLDTCAASITTERSSHAPGIIRGKWLFIDWFENSNIYFFIPNDVGATGSFARQLELHLLAEA